MVLRLSRSTPHSELEEARWTSQLPTCPRAALLRCLHYIISLACVYEYMSPYMYRYVYMCMMHMSLHAAVARPPDKSSPRQPRVVVDRGAEAQDGHKVISIFASDCQADRCQRVAKNSPVVLPCQLDDPKTIHGGI